MTDMLKQAVQTSDQGLHYLPLLQQSLYISSGTKTDLFDSYGRELRCQKVTKHLRSILHASMIKPCEECTKLSRNTQASLDNLHMLCRSCFIFNLHMWK